MLLRKCNGGLVLKKQKMKKEKREIRWKNKKTIFKEEKYTQANIEKPKKIGRNDPCLCGSGKNTRNVV